MVENTVSPGVGGTFTQCVAPGFGSEFLSMSLLYNRVISISTSVCLAQTSGTAMLIDSGKYFERNGVLYDLQATCEDGGLLL